MNAAERHVSVGLVLILAAACQSSLAPSASPAPTLPSASPTSAPPTPSLVPTSTGTAAPTPSPSGAPTPSPSPLITAAPTPPSRGLVIDWHQRAYFGTVIDTTYQP